MLKFALAAIAVLASAGVGRAQTTAGDQGPPGTNVNRNPAGQGTGTQGTATNNQSGRSGAARAGVAGQNPQAGTAANQPRQSGSLESHAADCLILKNEEEIALLQFASQKIQDDDLKQAAQKMIQDHQQAITKLERFAAHGGSRGQSNAKTTRTDSSANTTGASGTAVASRDSGQPQTREARRVGTDERPGGTRSPENDRQGAATMDHSEIHASMYQVAMKEKEECLRLTEADLNKHQGAKFDKVLAGQQCVMHTGMLAHLRALQGQGSSEFNQLLGDLEKTTQQHKDTLDGMMDKLAQNAESGRSRK